MKPFSTERLSPSTTVFRRSPGATQNARPHTTTQLQNAAPTTYYVFDVLDIDGTSTTELPYRDRREALSSLSIENPRIQVPPFWLNVDGAAMLEVAKNTHLGGQRHGRCVGDGLVDPVRGDGGADGCRGAVITC